MPIQARQHIKRMRGGANAHLMLADDDRYYVVKFRNNPQHSRILANELICSALLDHLDLPNPGWDVIEVSRQVIEASPGLEMEFGLEVRRCEPGLHFASRFPVDPVRQAVYDYVPLSLLRGVINLRAFLGMVVFDKWVSNVDGRQVIFFRDRAKRWLEHETAAGAEASPRSLVYVASMIDHGFAFGAHNWSFSDQPEIGLYLRREVYDGVKGYDSFQPWLDRIISLPLGALDAPYRQIPPEWYDHERERLEALLEELYRRRLRTPDLLRGGKRASRDPFPNWRAAAAMGGRA